VATDWNAISEKLKSAEHDLGEAATLANSVQDGTPEELSLLAEEVKDLYVRTRDVATRAELQN
jgi:hypothetical protein